MKAKKLIFSLLAVMFLAGVAYAATTYTDFVDGTYKNPNPVVRSDRLAILRAKVDFGHQALDAGLGDVHQVLDIPAGTYVLKVWVTTDTAVPHATQSPGATIDVGYGTDPDYWGDGLKIQTAGITGIPSTHTSDLSSLPLYFSSADTIDIKATTDTADIDLSAGVIYVNALVLLP